MAALLGGMVIAVVFVLGVSYHLSDWHWHEQLGAHASAWSRRGGGGPSPSAPSADDGAGPASAVPDAAAGGGATAAHDANARARCRSAPTSTRCTRSGVRRAAARVAEGDVHDRRRPRVPRPPRQDDALELGALRPPRASSSPTRRSTFRVRRAIPAHLAQFRAQFRRKFSDAFHASRRYLSEHRFVYFGGRRVEEAAVPADVSHGRGRQDHQLAPPPAAAVQWFFLVSDRTFVNVPQLLRLLGTLHSYLSYFGQVASATHKESFGFHECVT